MTDCVAKRRFRFARPLCLRPPAVPGTIRHFSCLKHAEHEKEHDYKTIRRQDLLGRLSFHSMERWPATNLNGSPGRTRTCSLAVTSAPSFRTGLDYLITPKGVGRFAHLCLRKEGYGLSA